MLGWVLQWIVAGSAVLSQSQALITYAKTIPPMPTQSSLTCHDAQWETANLTTVAVASLHSKLAPHVAQLITQAQSENVNLQINSAYRTCALQQQLRAQNCGIGDYNLYQKPSNLCLPPTEPAGKSLHNEGLAIDFGCAGYPLFETSPCLGWLKQNAARYFLYNHALEAWHWSTTGK